MRLMAMLLSAMALVSCSDGTNGTYTYTGIGVSGPSAAIGVQLSPQVVPFVSTPAIGACPIAPAFTLTTSIGLVVVQSKPTKSSVDSVTFRLISGESVGGPSITIPKPELTQMFGSTVVVPTSVFNFRPVFHCVGRPRSIAVDVVLIDAAGQAQTVSADAMFQ